MSLSKPQPVLITHWQEVAEEISCLSSRDHGLQQKQLDCLLRDLGAALHGPETPPTSLYASIISRVVRLGLHGTFEAVADEVVLRGLSLEEVLRMANALPGGNLACHAVLSGSPAALEKLAVLSAEAGVDLDGVEVEPESGMSALHWAAALHSEAMVDQLLRYDEGAAAAWVLLPGGENGLSPLEMLNPEPRLLEQQLQPLFSSDEESLAEDASPPPSLANPLIRTSLCLWGASTLLCLAILGIALSQCESLLLLVLTTAVLTGWLCWCKYANIVGKMRQLAGGSGFELTWFLASKQPAVEVSYCRFVTSKITPTENFCFGATLGGKFLCALKVARSNFGNDVNAVAALGLVAMLTSAGMLFRTVLIRRNALRSTEWFNMVVDGAVYLSFIAALWVDRRPGVQYVDLFSRPAPWTVAHYMTVAAVQSSFFFSPIRVMLPFRLFCSVAMMMQFYLSSLLTPVHGPLKTQWAGILVGCILSNGLYIVLRLQKEQANLETFFNCRPKGQ
mmetsp:Transcript_26536/g.74580  ORF Transcript_26536/g.74580 Transcript_26536/m.74580 type:complete len:506 (+) Transcript_26536:1-1518(+)